MGRWVCVVVAASLAIAACGSDDGGSEDTTADSSTTAAAVDTETDCRADVDDDFTLDYEVSGPHEVAVTCGVIYKTAASGIDQVFDIYRPSDMAPGEGLPTVVFFHSNGNPELGVWPEDREETIVWDWKQGMDTHARVVASMGMTGITFDISTYPMRSDYGEVTEENMGLAVADAMDLVAYLAANADDLNVDPANLCVWTNSTGSMVGAYVALTASPALRCAVVITGPLQEEFAGQYNPADLVTAEMPPFYVARGNQDIYSNDSIDRFAFLAREAGADQVTVDRVTANHAFDLFPQDLATTRAAMGKAFDFVAEHLGVAGE